MVTSKNVNNMIFSDKIISVVMILELHKFVFLVNIIFLTLR